MPSISREPNEKLFVSLPYSVRLDGMENHDSTICVLGFVLMLTLYRRWIPACAGMTSLVEGA
jgi:hypothetical protein